MGSAFDRRATTLMPAVAAGNILAEPACTIRPERYYCLDVIRDALEDAGLVVEDTLDGTRWNLAR